MQSKLHNVDQLFEKRTSNNELVQNIEKKLELIESGAKLANNCSKSLNCCRISINKVPFHPGENVRTIVHDFLTFLGIQDQMPNVTSCFRLPVKSSKWTDRTLTPTILVAYDSIERKNMVVKRYFEKHKEAKLCNLKSAAPLEYRFTVNEMMSLHTFRTRNLALRLKLKEDIKSVFVRNDNVSVKLPGKDRYVPVTDSNALIKLVEHSADTYRDESSVFFDAVSTGNSSFN